MKKRIVTIALVVALLATCFAGTYAYLQDDDSAINVMTMGRVEIVQHEKERAQDGSLQDFTQNKKAYPAVGEVAYEAAPTLIGGANQFLFADSLKNVVDKFVYVENTGKDAAYIRTIVLVEAPNYDDKDLIGLNVGTGANVTDLTIGQWTPVDINGVQWLYNVFTYRDALAPDALSRVSLAQLYLDKETTNEDCAAFGDTWEILALSQGVQEAGFADATTALNTAFGEPSVANVTTWFNAVINANP